MKRKVILGAAVVIGIVAVFFTSCKNKVCQTENAEEVEEITAQPEEAEKPFNAVKRYLTDEIGRQYLSGDVCIPNAIVIASDSTASGCYLFWGDFWVFNYEVAGDTLKTVSGGNHSGLMYVEQTPEGGFTVKSFDAVVDGAGNLESAKKIFGDKYEAYQAIHSNEQKREELRKIAISEYVNEHELAVTCYQDFGWPAISLQ